MSSVVVSRDEAILAALYAKRDQIQAVRETPASFAEYLSGGKWDRAPHLELLSSWLTDAASGQQQRIIVTMPPRHGKSVLVSKWFPIWALEKQPSRRVILCSYEADFAASWGRKVRDTIQAESKRLKVKLAAGNGAADRWETTAEGGMVTAGVGGPITGRGGDLLIIDDPVKNSAEADSETYRNRTWEWWQSTAYTRLEPGAAAIVVMTRWHEEDLAGRLILESGAGGEQWRVLNLPAIAEDDNDAIGRQVGEPLWPERYDIDALARIQTSVGSRVWASLYQQRPSPAEGGIIKRHWWRFWERRTLPERFDSVFQSWDMAFKDTKSSDFVVGQVWGKHGANFYLLDQVRDRLDFVATEDAVINLSAKWRQATAKYVEEKANGAGIIARLRSKVPGLIAVNPKDSKLARVNAITPLIEAGNVFLPHPTVARWVDELIEECAAFPNGAHDDMVDCLSQSLSKGKGAGRLLAMTGSYGY